MFNRDNDDGFDILLKRYPENSRSFGSFDKHISQFSHFGADMCDFYKRSRYFKEEIKDSSMSNTCSIPR